MFSNWLDVLWMLLNQSMIINGRRYLKLTPEFLLISCCYIRGWCFKHITEIVNLYSLRVKMRDMRCKWELTTRIIWLEHVALVILIYINFIFFNIKHNQYLNYSCIVVVCFIKSWLCLHEGNLRNYESNFLWSRSAYWIKIENLIKI